MKYNLVKKDALLSKRKVIFYTVFLLVVLLLVKLTIHHALIENILVAAIGGLFSYFITVILFEAEGKYKAEVTVAILPYTRKEIVLSKYSCVILGSLIFYILCFVEMGILTLFKIGTFSGGGIAYGIAVSFIIHAGMIPFFMKFDYIKAANVMMLGIMVWSVLFVLFAKKIVGFMDIVNGLQSLNIQIVLIVSIIILLVSYLMSVAIYEKKEL
ncbi:MAG: ABC-2 transporter permease [Lachnotalea sp.]